MPASLLRSLRGATFAGALFAAAALQAAEGDLDLGFNSTGKARVAFDRGGTEAGKADVLHAMVVQPDGRPILLGSVTDDVGLLSIGIARLRSNGTPDTGFDGDGKADFGIGDSTPQALALFDDGRFVVAFRTESGDEVLTRRAADGSGAPYSGSTFDYLLFDLPGASDIDIAALQPLPGGRLLVAGSYTAAAAVGKDFYVARLTANGALDPGFGTSSGYTRIDFGLDVASLDVPRALAVAADGRIAAVGSVSSGDREFGIVMLDADGDPIPAFDADGRAVVDFDIGIVSDDRGGGACFLPDGRLVVAGNVTDTLNPDTLAIAQLNANGALVPQFEGNGRRTVNLLTFGGLACTPDAKLLLTGTVDVAAPSLAPTEVFVARYDQFGLNDGSFASFGATATFGLNTSGVSGGRSDTGIAVALDARGRIYAGFDAQYAGADHDFAVARLQAGFLFADGFE